MAQIFSKHINHSWVRLNICKTSNLDWAWERWRIIFESFKEERYIFFEKCNCFEYPQMPKVGIYVRKEGFHLKSCKTRSILQQNPAKCNDPPQQYFVKKLSFLPDAAAEPRTKCYMQNVSTYFTIFETQIQFLLFSKRECIHELSHILGLDFGRHKLILWR